LAVLVAALTKAAIADDADDAGQMIDEGLGGDEVPLREEASDDWSDSSGSFGKEASGDESDSSGYFGEEASDDGSDSSGSFDEGEQASEHEWGSSRSVTEESDDGEGGWEKIDSQL